MSFDFELSEDLERTLDKLASRDKSLAVALRKKIDQIISLDERGIEHFKNLQGGMSHLKRVHVGSFILTFRVSGKKVIFERFAHHDDIYR